MSEYLIDLTEEQTYKIHNGLYELKVLGNPQINELVKKIEEEIGMRYNIQKNFGDGAF